MAKVVDRGFADRVTMIFCAFLRNVNDTEAAWDSSLETSIIKKSVYLAGEINKEIENYLNDKDVSK